jgi:hypothetical protein
MTVRAGRAIGGRGQVLEVSVGHTGSGRRGVVWDRERSQAVLDALLGGASGGGGAPADDNCDEGEFACSAGTCNPVQ